MKYLIIVKLFVIFSFRVFAQSNDSEYRTCSTSEKYNELLKKNPNIQELMDRQSKFAKKWTNKNYGKSNSTGKKTISYIIPVVWHVIHDNGPENISKDSIVNEIAKLNLDFQKLNSDVGNVHALFAGIVADCEIEFRLATIDPDGNCTEGITRTESKHTYLMDDPYTVRPSWNTPTRKYLNIWQGKVISFGAGGYAYYPGTVPDEMEGIVLIAQQLGNTVTHEVGHWLNLAHTWGHSNSPQDPANCFQDDDVADTPNTIGKTGCSDTASSCGSIDNVQNYMEYNFCDLMFTEGQKQRMHAALNSPDGFRDYIVSQTNLINTGTADPYNPNPICTPIANFKYNKRYLCEGEQVLFTDSSYNATPTSWDWVFNGGTPSSSNIQNPIITYNSKGVYSAINRPGTTAGVGYHEKNNIIFVSNDNADFSVLPFSDDFESLSAFNTNWMIVESAQNNWNNTSVASFSGNRSVMISNVNNSFTEISDLISPSYDLTLSPNMRLTYKYAYAKKLNGGNDRLVIYYTTNCGKTWNVLKAKLSSTLSTSSPTDSYFIPTNSDWKEDTIDLSSLTQFNNVKFRFMFRNSGGNNFWMDDINIGIVTGIDDPGLLSGVYVYPNPTTKHATISFNVNKNINDLNISICDVIGKEVCEVLKNQKFAPGKFSIPINQFGNLTKGVYFIRFEVDGKNSIQKLIIQ
ncbi:MAG: T9SS type A sorting domain-containing protein [Flavobacteriales bacterium]|nr:T9SS type A sorting domain-containing protein [Flavobacteriales bacterium]